MSAAAPKPRVLLGLTGSVASTKAKELVGLLISFAEVKVVKTAAAAHFFETDALVGQGCEVYGDADDWHSWEKKGDPVLHIDLRKWADLLVIAPLSANTLAKITSGVCDNLLTSVVRAWDFGKPMLVAPAMNTFMWDSPFTAKQLNVLRELGVHVMEPVSKVPCLSPTTAQPLP